MKFHKKFVEYLKSKRPELAYYEDDEDSFSYGRFPDDMFDQSLSTFYYLLAKRILKTNDINNINPDINPNEGIDKAIKTEVEQLYLNYEKDEEYFKLEVYPEEFKNNVRKWIIVHLEEEFLRFFLESRTKFSNDSLEKLIEAGMKNILINGYYGIQFEGSVEGTVEYINRVMVWYEKISFQLLYLIIDDFYRYLYGRGFIIGGIYKKIQYWIKPEKYFPPLKVKESKNYRSLDLMINNIMKIENSNAIPGNSYEWGVNNFNSVVIFSEELKKKIKKFIKDILKHNVNLCEDGEVIPKSLLKKLYEIGYRLFLHFAYFGLVNGKIPGIKQGAYSTDQLERELDEFYQFKIENR